MSQPPDRALLREILDELRDQASAMREIVDEVRRLRADLAPRRSTLRADLGEFLQAIAKVVAIPSPRGVEHRTFSVTELLVHAALVPQGEVLRSAIIKQVGTLNGRKLGKLLRRIEGEEIAGLRVERIDQDRDGVVWALRVCEFESRKPALPVARR